MAEKVFKNKLTKAQEDLFKSLDNEKSKRKVIEVKIINEISKQNKASVRTLNSLYKEFQDNCKTTNQEINEFVTKLNAYNLELQEGVTSFKNTYSIDNEKEKLDIQKEKDLQPIKVKFKREIHDINIRIDRTYKELKEILDSRQNELVEKESEYKQKIIEFDKRKRHEVSKIQSNTIKEYDELQKKLLLENKRSEIKKINKQIKYIREDGLIKERDTIKNYIKAQVDYEMQYIKNLLDFKLETARLMKEYNLKATSSKKERSMHIYNHHLDMLAYDTEVEHNLNQVNKQIKYKHNSFKNNLINEINKTNVEKLNLSIKHNNLLLGIQSKCFNEQLSLEKSNSSKYQAVNQQELNSLINSIKLFQKNLNTTFNFYLEQITAVYNSYFQLLFSNEEIYINNIIIKSLKNEMYFGFDNKDYIEKIDKAFIDFRSLEDQFVSKFVQKIKDYCLKMSESVNEFVNNMSSLNSEIVTEIKEYHDKIESIMATLTDDAIIFVKKNNQSKNELNQMQIEEINKEKAVLLKELEEEKVEIENEFKSLETTVFNHEENNKLTLENELNKIEIENKENETIVINDYEHHVQVANEKYNARYIVIKEKEKEEIEKIDKEYSTKIGLL